MRLWKRLGGEIYRVRVAPWSRNFDSAPFLGRPVVPFGGFAFCLELAQNLRISLAEPNLGLLSELEACWVRRRIEVKPAIALTSQDFPRFVKSCEYSLVPSQVYESHYHFKKAAHGIPPDTPLLVAEVVKFSCEIRTLVCNSEVLSATPYHKSSGVHSGAVNFVAEFAKRVPLPQACIVDVGRLPDDSWAIVEANPIWAADPLGLDLEAFVLALGSCCMTAR